jgi:uncharacterized protein (DUF302 family)
MDVRSIDRVVGLPMDQAEEAVRAALKDQGFGVLTEIDVAAVLKEKIGVERPGLKILGACNPGFANRALEIDPHSSLLLPCNVVLHEVEGGTRVSAVDPRTMMDHPQFNDLTADVAQKLEAALAALPAG